MQAKPERQTPINAGAYDSYNVMMKYIKNTKKYQNAYTKATKLLLAAVGLLGTPSTLEPLCNNALYAGWRQELAPFLYALKLHQILTNFHTFFTFQN